MQGYINHYRETFVPNDFHKLQVQIGAAILLVAMILHTFGPPNQTDVLHDVILVTLAFLFGKFTNGVTRGKPTTTTSLTSQENTDATDTNEVVPTPLPQNTSSHKISVER